MSDQIPLKQVRLPAYHAIHNNMISTLPAALLLLLTVGMLLLPAVTCNVQLSETKTGSSRAVTDALSEVHGKTNGIVTREAEKVITVSMSAYTSRVKETDSTPCISADGTNICKYDGCVVASNDYPFDTVLLIEGFGECIVKDRMSSRYTGTGNMDIYFGKDLKGALQFGRQNLKVRVTT